MRLTADAGAKLRGCGDFATPSHIGVNLIRRVAQSPSRVYTGAASLGDRASRLSWTLGRDQRGACRGVTIQPCRKMRSLVGNESWPPCCSPTWSAQRRSRLGRTPSVSGFASSGSTRGWRTRSKAPAERWRSSQAMRSWLSSGHPPPSRIMRNALCTRRWPCSAGWASSSAASSPYAWA